MPDDAEVFYRPVLVQARQDLARCEAHQALLAQKRDCLEAECARLARLVIAFGHLLSEPVESEERYLRDLFAAQRSRRTKEHRAQGVVKRRRTAHA